MIPKTSLVFLALFLSLEGTKAQQADSSAVQSRLFNPPTFPNAPPINGNGTALPSADDLSSDDNSFGTQIILKNQERPKPFSVFGGISVFRTSNVALTRDQERADTFLTTDLGAAWRPAIVPSLAADVSVALSTFRYDRASELDFNRLSSGVGLTWAVPHAGGILAYGRYDFTEVVQAHGGDQLLQDHAFTLGGQRTFVFGRSHSLTAGISGSGGLSSPGSLERQQTGTYFSYHLQFTRSLSGDLLYRYAAQFYTEGGRTDHNQTLSLALGYTPARWLRIDALASGARNDSNQKAFAYKALNLGGGLRFVVGF